MTVDHSETYRSKTLRNYVHRKRLTNIIATLDRIDFKERSFADFGCSNGYVTSLIAERYKPRRARGFDNCCENIGLARARYPTISFGYCDLNAIGRWRERFDVVTCFEVLEHVGNISNSIHNLLNATAHDGTIIITVPIEAGFRGLLKFLLKTLVYRDKLQELPRKRLLYLRYLLALTLNRDISWFREVREQWGTHFGFDYRVVDHYLNDSNQQYKAINKYTTRFYVIKRCMEAHRRIG